MAENLFNLRSAQDIYTQDVKPREQAKVAAALGKLGSTYSSQANAARIRGSQLAQRSGFGGTGVETGLRNTLQYNLGDALNRAMIDRRKALQDEVSAFRDTEMQRALDKQAQEIGEIGQGWETFHGLAGTIGGAALSMIPFVGQAAGATASTLQPAMGREINRQTQADIANVANQGYQAAPDIRTGESYAVANAPRNDLSTLGTRLASRSGSALYGDDEDNYWG